MTEKYEEYPMAKIEEDRKNAIENDLARVRENNKKEKMKWRLEVKANRFKEQLDAQFGLTAGPSLEEMESAEKALDEALYSIAPGSRPYAEKED